MSLQVLGCGSGMLLVRPAAAKLTAPFAMPRRLREAPKPKAPYGGFEGWVQGWHKEGLLRGLYELGCSSWFVGAVIFSWGNDMNVYNMVLATIIYALVHMMMC